MNAPFCKIEKVLHDVLALYDLHVDLKGVIGEIPQSGSLEYLTLIQRVLEKLGFKTKYMDIEHIHVEDNPYPFLLEHEGDVALHLPSNTHQIPQSDLLAVDGGERRGQVLCILAPPLKVGVQTDHMRIGHALDWFWQPIIRYKNRYFEILLVSVFINLFVLALPLYTMNAYDRVVINFAQETLIVLTIGVLLALTFDFLFKIMRSYILERVAEDVGKQFDFELMERFFRLKNSQAHLSIGERANIFRELQGIREFYAGRLMPTLIDLPFALLFVGVIYALSPAVALVPIVITVLILCANWAAHIPVNRMMEEYFTTLQGKSSLLIEMLAGLETTRMFNALSARLFTWHTHITRSAQVARHNALTMSFMSSLSLFLSQIGQIMIIFVGMYQIHAGHLTIGGLIACTILAGRAIGPIVNLSGVIARLKQSNDVLAVIDKFFQAPYEDANDLAKSAKGPFAGQITLQKICAQYPGQNRLALEAVNLDIKAGDTIGLIGKTAAGKSTLAKILANHMAPQQGSVALDGYEYDTIPPTEIRRTIAYVPQDSFFFRGSIRHNIVLGREGIDPEALEEAIFVSGLDLVMQDSAQGLDTEVGEFGAQLSGGQKQAISLARALAQKPRILIFDEPTTGMDNNLEHHVKQRLQNYIQDKTFIMVTHRTTLLSLVDRLILLDRGRIIADGARDEILKKLKTS